MSSSIEFADNYTKWILDTMSRFIGKRLLEIGTGQGNYSRYLRLSYYMSCDIDESVIERARTRDPNGTYEIADVTGNDFISRFRKHKFDTVLCFNVLEHIREDSMAVHNMMNVLVPHGFLLVLSPAIPVLFGQMDHLSGHYRRYTKSSLRKLFNETGYQVRLLRYFNFTGGIGWWINKMYPHRDLDSKSINRQVILFDRWIVPYFRRLDSFMSRAFGQSIICAIQRSDL